MAGSIESSTVDVGVIIAENRINISKELAPAVKLAAVNGNVVPLFPTKNGYEYFVFRTPRRR